ncbi:MAG: ATP-dependent DNA helicase RecG [Candidatus Gastranaerophilales bacterium]|nr:ATP-dependent DNA helicase RecG [Candidatus Gastranaerophilales bacterium]
MGFDEIYEKIKQATTLEVKYQYINFDGKKTNFSKFMIGILYDVLKKINKVEKQNIAQLINLFESYHIDSVHNRRYTIDRTLETFARLRKIIKPKTASEKKETKATKEFFEEIDEVNVEFVKGVGPQIAKLFNKINIFKVKDLIEYYPRKYVDYQGQNKIRDLKLGEQVSIYGTIIKVNHYTTPNKLTIFTVYIKDSTGVLPINFFLKTNNRKIIESYKQAYPINSMALALGKVKFDDYYSRTTLDKAQIQVLGQGAELDINRNNIVPIYALCENLNPKTLTNAINNALVKFQDNIYDPLPNDIIEKFNFIGKKEAIIDLHKPKNLDEVDVARKRLVFDELFSMQLNLALIRKETGKDNSIKLEIKEGGLVDKFIKNLPFELTNAQKTALDEILKDLNSTNPMQRLLQGDVGSGKTVVACIALLCAIENGYQGAIMAPTEILAIQHYKNFASWLLPLGLSVGLFVGKNSAKVRKESNLNLKNGQIHVAVGTHALIQEGVEFNNLGVVVIDEQHRFGVKQRNALLNKGKMPQMLNMTATPIPRTLALTLHGDLDISIINELPKGRKPIITTLGGINERKKAYELIKKELFFKHQAYIVYPLIEESEAITAKAATLEAQKLQEGEFSQYKIGLLHGKMSGDEKDEVMNDFKAGKYDILVATTVVEVGVDNPNATVIVIENAERFGLSQLHQLRGRVGRSDLQSYCTLITQSTNPEVKKRLEIMTKTNDGFIISQKDLEIRGPGEFLGTRQSGLPDFKLADLVNDSEILEKARQEAFEFVNTKDINDYPLLKKEAESHNLFRG